MNKAHVENFKEEVPEWHVNKENNQLSNKCAKHKHQTGQTKGQKIKLTLKNKPGYEQQQS